MAEQRFCIDGEIDMATAPELQASLDGAVGFDSDLLVDCTRLTFIDSSGIAVLINTKQALAARGQRLRIANASVMIERLFTITGLSEILHPDDQAASRHVD